MDHLNLFCTLQNHCAAGNHELWPSSDDPEELAYYNKIRKEMDEMKKEPVKKGIPLNWDTPERMDK